MPDFDESAVVVSPVEVALSADNEEAASFEAKNVAVLGFGHLMGDCYPAFISPLLPLLIPKLGLSIGLAGILATLQTVSGSLTQPIFGYLADRISGRLFIVVGVAVSAVFFSLVGLAPNYPVLLLLVLIGGAGVASFHPSGAVMVSEASRQRRNFGMSLYISAGNVGFAIGPMLITTAVMVLTLERSFVVAIPGIVMAMLLLRFAPHRKATRIASAPATQPEPVRSDYLRPLVFLVAVVVLQSSTAVTFSTFVPTYLQGEGYSLLDSSIAVSLFIFCGSLGVLASGYLADAIGRYRIIVFGLLFSAPLFYLFLHTSGFLSLIILGLAGFLIQAPSPLTIVMGQELVPKSANTISGLVMGFAWGLGAFFLTAVGLAADRIGLPTAMTLMTSLPILAVLVSTGLPRERRRQVVSVKGAD
ncbi:MAG: MFS transporter [Chloroflexi bacterium]|nr:MFS transporter [Chloroflexota bacterium]